MYNLDKILDNVRENYYKSKVFKRPTISWSDEFWTDYFGRYDFYKNHITISRILNDIRVSEEMISSVVYHESLHQDFPEHDNKFNAKAKLFPKYKSLEKKLTDYASTYHSELEYTNFINDFSRNKQFVRYIVLPRYEDYLEAFEHYDSENTVDFNLELSDEFCNANALTIFLVKNTELYNIVAWSTSGNMYNTQQIINLDDYDLSFQFKCNFNDIKIMPITNCDYTIPINEMPEELDKLGYAIFPASDSSIKPDIDYLDSYSEGFFEIGFDLNNIDACPYYNDSVELSLIKKSVSYSFRGLWIQNEVCKREPSKNNFLLRADIKKYARLISSAKKDIELAQLYD